MKSLRLLGILLGLALGASCDEPAPVCGAGAAQGGETRTLVTRKLGFAIHEEDGTIDGFDLDNFVTAGALDETVGCAQIDATSPSGERGIDNNLSTMLEFIIELTGDAVDGLVQSAINDGTLLVMFRLEGVDDPMNDPCVQVQILKGSGRPQLATTGFIAPSQTFGVDETTPMSTGMGRIENGILYAGPFEATIPLRFFGVSANIRLHDALLRGELGADGTLSKGMIGGGIELEQIYDLAMQAGAMDHNAAQIANAAPAFLMAFADLADDGVACQQISAALRLEAEPAFLLGDEIPTP